MYGCTQQRTALCGAIRRLYQVPTQSMLGDGLTKVMHSEQILQLLYHGTFTIKNEVKHQVRVRIIPADAIRHDFSEKDLSSEQAMLRLKG